jgi:hypothetical protein
MLVMIGVIASPAASTTTADDGPIAPTGTPRDRQCGIGCDIAQDGGERRDQTAQCQPARSGSA